MGFVSIHVLFPKLIWDNYTISVCKRSQRCFGGPKAAFFSEKLAETRAKHHTAKTQRRYMVMACACAASVAPGAVASWILVMLVIQSSCHMGGLWSEKLKCMQSTKAPRRQHGAGLCFRQPLRAGRPRRPAEAPLNAYEKSSMLSQAQ